MPILVCPVCGVRKKIHQIRLGRRGQQVCCSHKCAGNLLSEKYQSVGNPFFGKKHYLETRKQIGRASSKLWQDSGFRQRTRLAQVRGIGIKPNKVELRLESILNKHYAGEWKYTGDGSHTIGGFPVDFTNCNGLKAIIELFGDYWHGKKLRFWHQSELGRIMAYNSLGFRCLVIWEHELKDEQAVVAKVKQFMKRRS